MKKNSELEKSGNKHYILPLPVTGIPMRIKRLIKEVRKEHGVAHVHIYQTPDVFSVRCRGHKDTRNSARFMSTSFWIEISNKSLKMRSNPDWPSDEIRKHSSPRRFF